MKNIAIFASGTGSNAENLIRYFSANSVARVKLVLTNRAAAGVVERARSLGVETAVFDRDTFVNSKKILELLQDRQIDFLVLAGFLWLVPPYLLKAFPHRIVNIHPSLLPRHGGRGMYGERVHQAVVEAGDSESGITIHRIDEHYDQGCILAQYRVPVTPSDSPLEVAQKVHALEYEYYPQVIEREIQAL